MAPEIARQLVPSLRRQGSYGLEIDWYTLGVLVFELTTGEPPFRARGQSNELYKTIAVCNLKIPRLRPELSPELQDFLRQTICQDPQARLGSLPGGAKEVQAHAWFIGAPLPLGSDGGVPVVLWEDVFAKKVTPDYVPRDTAANFPKGLASMDPCDVAGLKHITAPAVGRDGRPQIDEFESWSYKREDEQRQSLMLSTFEELVASAIEEEGETESEAELAPGSGSVPPRPAPGEPEAEGQADALEGVQLEQAAAGAALAAAAAVDPATRRSDATDASADDMFHDVASFEPMTPGAAEPGPALEQVVSAEEDLGDITD